MVEGLPLLDRVGELAACIRCGCIVGIEEFEIILIDVYRFIGLQSFLDERVDVIKELKEFNVIVFDINLILIIVKLQRFVDATVPYRLSR